MILKVLRLVAATILMEHALEVLRMQCANAQSEYYQCAGAHTGSSVFQRCFFKFNHANILCVSVIIVNISPIRCCVFNTFRCGALLRVASVFVGTNNHQMW